jgi:hypothetical protein
VERRVVLGVHGVGRDPQQRRPDDRPVGERGVEVGRVEAGQPVPQGDVRRGGLLSLEGGKAADGGGHVQRLAGQEQLPAEGGPVEPPGGEGHAG